MEKTVGVEVLEIVPMEDGSGKDHSSNSPSRVSIGSGFRKSGVDANSFLVVIQIWTSDGHRYTVSRTYKSFVNLQAQLTRKYPRSTIPALPKAVDVTSNKKSSINEYIAGLMQIPELLQSDTFLSFLDEESTAEGEFTHAHAKTYAYIFRVFLSSSRR